MRTIKFRAWHKELEMMLPPVDLSQPLQHYKWLGRADHPIMQFTGLHDKNGKEIYEGDIIEYENYITCEVHTDIIEWKECTCFVGECTLYDVCIYPHKDIEVIGNIYEHKHLLKK